MTAQRGLPAELFDLAARRAVLGGVETRYLGRSASNGPTLVFAHGLTGQAEIWLDLVAHLPSHWGIYLLDMAGRGWSGIGDRDASGDVDLYEAMVHQVEGLVAAERLSRPILVGSSLGALVSVLYALRHPGDVAGLVLTNSGLIVNKPERQRANSSLTTSSLGRWPSRSQSALWSISCAAAFSLLSD